MKKPVDQQIKECVKRISEEDLRFIYYRLSQRLCGDLGEALAFINSNYHDLNSILSSASSHAELYNMIDILGDNINKRLK
jgi:hypothetical protein